MRFPVKYWLIVFAIGFTITGCSNDQIEMQEVDVFIDNEVPVDEDPSVQLRAAEIDYLNDLLKVDSHMDNYWPRYVAFRNSPIFILTGPDRGIFINPPESQMKYSREISYEFEGYESLALFRNDSILEFVKDKLLGNNNRFYQFLIYDEMYFMGYDIVEPLPSDFYFDYKNRNGYFHVSVFFHELSHLFHNSEDIYPLFDNGNRIQDLTNFPINEETLPLFLLLFDVMKDAYHVNPGQQLDYLKYYVSIWYELNRIDPTKENLIRHHGFYQEKSEGVARYIEVFSTLDVLNNNTVDDPTHGYAAYAENISSAGDVRSLYGIRMFYHTGAGAIYLMKELGFKGVVDQFYIPTNTPYDIAADYLNMNSLELEEKLDEAKSVYDWEEMVIRANYLLNL